MEGAFVKTSRGRQRWVLGILLIWAVVSLASAYTPALMGACEMADSVAAKIHFGIPNLMLSRNFVAWNVSSAFWLLQALAIAIAGCCAVLPTERPRRIAWILYGILVASALSLPFAEGGLSAWAGTPAWLCPDAVWIGLGFGLGGLVLMWISRRHCPNPDSGTDHETGSSQSRRVS